ncbi:MAG: hypothetical protein Q4D04_15965, partial [Clostridia bacterium]|nr:hypothetical protein [Clostridia bacterium]
MHVLITPEIAGTPESVENARLGINEKNVTATTGWNDKTSDVDLGPLNGLFGTDTIEKIKLLTETLKDLEANKGTWMSLWGLTEGMQKNSAEEQLNSYMNPETLAALQSYVSEVLALIQSGGEISEEDEENLQAILDFVSALEVSGVGQNIVAGIGESMAAAGWSGYASTVSGNLLAAINAALGINSPATTMIPVGSSVSEGIAQGMASFSFAAAGAGVSAGVKAATDKLPSMGALAGQNFARGLANGITSGTEWIKAAARKAALAAKTSAESALEQNSPSRVGRRIGEYFTKGIALGIEDEKQVKAIRNASRFIGASMENTSYSSVSNDNRKTWNQDQSLTLNVEALSVKDKQDIRALALEINNLKRRVTRSKGGAAYG